MKKLGITDKNLPVPATGALLLCQTLSSFTNEPFGVWKQGRILKPAFQCIKKHVDALKEALLLGEKERKCKQYVSWYSCQQVLTASTQPVDQRSGAKANGPVWSLLADVGSPRLSSPSGPPLSVLDSWSIVGSF